jgi:16S rRNA (guanine966-N2)-methyltransferase
VRVIAGHLGGRRLLSVVGDDVRPTSDRVREALFNRLQSRGLVSGATVLDLFAGSGALGIEALSRGARCVTFVDRDRRSIEVVRANLAALGLADRTVVHQADALSFLGGSGRVWDLALLDPPYEFAEWPALLDALPAAVAVLETPAQPEPPSRWTVLHQKRYGRTHVSLLGPAG